MDELQKGLVNLVDDHKKQVEENRILRNASRIVFMRDKNNPAKTKIKIAPNVYAEITVKFVEE